MEQIIISIVSAIITSIVTVILGYLKYIKDIKEQQQEQAEHEIELQKQIEVDRAERYDRLEEKWISRLNQEIEKLKSSLEQSAKECEEKIERMQVEVDSCKKELNGHEDQVRIWKKGVNILIKQLRRLNIEPEWEPPEH